MVELNQGINLVKLQLSILLGFEIRGARFTRCMRKGAKNSLFECTATFGHLGHKVKPSHPPSTGRIMIEWCLLAVIVLFSTYLLRYNLLKLL